MTPRSTRLLLGLALLVPLLWFWQRGLHEPDEGRYVEIAREMWTTGDYIVPRIKGIPHYAKPPFTYWALAFSMQIFGANEFAARLPGTLAAILILLMVFDLARRLSGSHERGLMAALALAVTLEFFALSRIITTDMLLVLFTTVAVWALLRAENQPKPERRRWNLLFHLALGLGFLTKGPVILAVVGSGMLATSLLLRDWRLFRQRHWRFGLPLFIVVALPWYLIVASREPKLYDFFLGSEVVDRVASGRGRRKAFYYFLIILPLALLPFMPFVFAAARRLWSRRSELAIALLLGFVIGPFLVFSLAASKLWTYILPVIPLALLLFAVGTKLKLNRAFAGLWVLGLALGLGADVLAERQALELGNNVGYRVVAEAFAGQSFRGIPIPTTAEEQAAQPTFRPGPEVRIATFRLRFTAAAFYFLAEKPDYLPIYGGDSLWEWDLPKHEDQVLGLDDLIAEMRKPEAMIVLLKREHLAELEAAWAKDLPILESFGETAEAVVALSND